MKILKATLQWSVLVIFLVLAFLMIRKQINQTFGTNMVSPVEISRPEKSGSSHSGESTDVVSTSAQGEQRDPREVAVVDNWFKLKGYSTEGEKAYDVYSDEQLLEMMKQGNVTAFDALSLRYISRGDLKRQFEVAEQSIPYGSLNGISRMAEKFSRYINADDSPEYRAEAKQNLKMHLSYLQLLSLRGAGELYSIHISEKVELNRFREIYGEEPLTPEDYQWISKKAQELYDHYQSERNKLGLGDFDNEMPSEVKKFLGL